MEQARSASIGTLFFKIAILVLLYVISGKLGLLLAVPPGYATVIWPASGIAIGMLLLHGWRLWPGILIGSFILNCYISNAFSLDHGFIADKTLAAAGIACGSTLQALVGYWLVNRFIGLPLKLKDMRDTLLLFILCGPTSCLIAASIGIGTLYFTGVLPIDKITGNWFTWSMGDLFGVIVFLPLMLVAPGNKNKLTWRGSVLSNLPILAMLVLLIPLGLTFYSWKITSENAYHTNNSQFEALAQENETALLHRINSYNYALLGARGFFEGSDFVSRKEWKEYVDTLNIEQNFPGINGIGLIMPVQPEKLKAFVANIRKSDLSTFTIHPETKDRPYYIISYIEPTKLNLAGIGLNIGFEDNRKQAAELSRDSGKSVITKKIILVQDEQKNTSFLLLTPIYSTGFPVTTIEERRHALQGWVYSPFIANNFLSNLTNSQNKDLYLEVYDGNKIEKDSLIFNDKKIEKDNESNSSKFLVEKHLKVMEQDWTLVWKSTKSFELDHQSNGPLMILIGGLVFTVFFGVFLLTVTVSNMETIELVSGERTLLLPMIIFIVTSISVFYLYNDLKNRELDYVRYTVKEEAKKIEQLVTFQTREKLLALKRMGQRWETSGGTPYNQWLSDAENYVSQLNGLKAMEWVDSTYHVRWVVPLKGNEKAQGLDVLYNVERQQVLKGAAEKTSITLTPPIDLVQGYKAFIAYAPVKVNGKFDGFITGIFDINQFFENVVSKEASGKYAVYLQYQGNEFFHSRSAGNITEGDLNNAMSAWSEIQVYDKAWQIKVVPTKQFVEGQKSSLPIIILITGLIISGLLSLIVRFILISKIKAKYLKASEERYNLVVRGMSVGLWDWNMRTGEMYWSPKLLQIFGLKDTNFVPTLESFSGILHPDDKDATLKALEGHIKHMGPYSVEYRVLADNGSYNWVQASGQAQWDHTGEPIRMAGSVVDITLRKNAEDALKMSEETFRSALENASIGMALVSIEGKWLTVNKSLCDLMGYDEQELLQLDFQTITHPDDLTADLENVNHMLRGEILTYQMEKRYFHKKGHVIWTMLNVSLAWYTDGKPKYFISQIQDITERKKMDQMKSEFISIVSHELRTPLTSIRGSLGLIEGAFFKEIPPKVRELVSLAYKNCERLILLINDILDMDKIAAGEMRFDMKDENLSELIKQGVQTNASYGDKYKVTYQTGIISPDVSVKVDGSRLQQVFSNLLSNAAKFSPIGSIVDIIVTENDRYVRVSVKDNGPGISDEFKSKIFGKFIQADSTLTREKGGTGLGLHISKQIIEKMKGRIGFDTKVGVGTTFWFELPIYPFEDEKNTGLSSYNDTSQQAVIASNRMLPRILHIEDDFDFSNILAATLKDKAQLVSAGSIKAAKKLLQQGDFSLIVLDIGLPDGTGLDLLAEISNANTDPIPVIILSANENLDDTQGQVVATLVKSRVPESKIIDIILASMKNNSKTGK